VRVVTLNPGPVATEFQDVAGTVFGDNPVGLRTPQQVVAAALGALERGQRTITPGLVNRLSTYVVRVSPRGVVIRTAKTIMKKMR
jgi:short-subunit dehydrogenase